MNIGRFILALAALCAAYALTPDREAPPADRRSMRDEASQPAAVLRLVPLHVSPA